MPSLDWTSTAFETLGEATLGLDVTFRLTAINEIAQHLYGVTSEWAVGRMLNELIGDALGGEFTRQPPSQAMIEAFQIVRDGGVWRGVVWHTTPGGRRFRADLSVRGLLNDAAQLEGLIAVVRDVTAQDAENLRRVILSDCLRAMAGANTPEAVQSAVLDGLTASGGADAAILRERQPEGFRLMAARGLGDALLEAGRVVHPTVDELAQLTAGGVLSADLPQGASGPFPRLLGQHGFGRIISVGQRGGGELIGTIVLLYRNAPEVDLGPVMPSLGAALGNQLQQTRGRMILERRNNLLELLNRIDHLMLENTPLGSMLDALALGLQTLFGVRRVGIGLSTADAKHLTWLARIGTPGEPGLRTVPVGAELGRAISSGRVTRLGVASAFGLYATMHLPDGILLLALEDRRDEFDPDDERDAHLIVTQFALAYRRVLDQERLKRERLGLEALVEATRTLRTAESEAELDQIAVTHALSVTNADAARVVLRGGEDALTDALDAGPIGAPGKTISVPIRVTDGQISRAIGSLQVDSNARSQAFDENDIARLTAVAEALGSARARLQALEQARERARAFERLAQLSSSLEKLEQPADIAREGLRALIDLTGFAAGVYATIESGRVRVTQIEGVSQDALEPMRAAFEVSPQTGLFGEASAQGKPLIIEDYRLRPAPDASFLAIGLRSLLLAPVYLNAQVQGFLGVGSFGEAKTLRASTSEVVEFLTGRLSRALERAAQIREITVSEATAVRALDQAEERARAFTQLAALSAELEAMDDPRDIARRGLQTLLELTGLDGAIYAEITDGHVRVLEQHGVVPAQVIQWYDGNPVDEWADRGLLAALHAPEPLVIEDYINREGGVIGFRDLGITTFVIASIRIQDRPQGFVAAASLSRHQPLPGGVNEFVQFLTARISRALERVAHLGEVLQSEVRALNALSQAEQQARAFIRLAQLSADLEAMDDPRDIAQRALETLIELTELEGAAYVELDGNRVRVAERRGWFPDGFMDVYDGSDTFGWGGEFIRDTGFRSAEGVFTASDVLAVPELAGSAVERAGVRSVVMAPVRIGKSFVGYVAAANFSQPSAFAPGTSEITRFIGRRIARALERISQTSALREAEAVALEARDQAAARARGFEQLAELSARLEAMDELRAIAGDGLETLLELTGLDAGAYYEISNGQLIPLETRGEIPDVMLKLTERPSNAVEGGLFTEMLKSGHPVIVPDYREYAHATSDFASTGVRTVVLAPVRFGGRTRGFIGAASQGVTCALPNGTLELVEFISARIARALERSDQVAEIMATRASSFQALSRTLEARDFEARGHTDRVTRLALDLGKEVGLDRISLQSLEWGAYLHDIGKVAIPDAILLKPGPLTPEEWRTVREHPVVGYGILEDLHFLPLETLQVVRYHQERTDGSGYPDGLYGPEIPYLARLFAVAEVYDALISTRPYKPPWSHAEAVAELEAQSGRTLDAEIVAAFMRVLKRQRGS